MGLFTFAVVSEAVDVETYGLFLGGRREVSVDVLPAGLLNGCV